MIRRLISIGVWAVALFSAASVHTQTLNEPVLESDVAVQARSATLVRVNGAQLLLLEGDVSFSVGGYGFRAKAALVRITRRPGLGEPVRDFAVYFDKARSIGEGGVQAGGDGLLVTVASRGKVELTAELVRNPELPESRLTRQALERFEQYDQRLRTPLLGVPAEQPLTPEQRRLRDRRRAEIEAERRRIDLPRPGEAPTDDELVARPVLPTRGTVRYGPIDRFVYLREQNAVVLLGGVELIYDNLDEARDVTLRAERIVVFLDGEAEGDDPAVGEAIDVGRVTGVYLEDDIRIQDGETYVRAPRAFYDLKTNRAILLDAVVWRYDPRYRVPLYMRADVIRQTSADSFSAKDALFTTSEFGKPHLSIGASKITLQQAKLDDGTTESWVEADGLTVRSGDTPIFYWPTATVEAGSIPIRRIKVGYEGENGADLQTTWDLFALAGARKPEGVELLGQLDYRGEHGLGLGLDLDYDRGESRGDLRGYFLPDDSGTDEIARRAGVGFDNDTRGFFRARHQQQLPAGWELWLEANHVSDPTLLEEFFPGEAYAARPYETSAYFKKAEDDWALSALIKGETNNFTPQLAPLLTPGYTVNKLPEAEYRQTSSILNDSATLYHESRVGRMRAVFGDDSPGERGLSAAQSAAAFGLAPGTSFDAAALAAGFPRSVVTRLDSRTELAAPLRAGALDVTPFAVGRVTAYDDDFSAFNGGNDDQARLWGGLGVKASTQFSKTDDTIHSRLFDVQGIRHIIEPGVTLALYDGTMNASDLPIYDPEVERLTEGGVMRVGVVNTWQTRRGGPGRSRSVDWIRLRTDVVLATEDSSNPAAIGRYYDYRPEYTLGDDHFYGELMWAVTEATALTGDLTHNFDEGSVVQWRVGIENQHTNRLSSFIHYREIDALDARLLSYGASLQLTTKYRFGVFQIIDFGEGNARTINLAIDRRIPRANLGLVVGYDDIDGEATLSIVLTPEGADRGFNGAGFFGGR
ncbi:MAG: LPS assembly protein LptD [Phycisphaeraceae bacterium]